MQFYSIGNVRIQTYSPSSGSTRIYHQYIKHHVLTMIGLPKNEVLVSTGAQYLRLWDLDYPQKVRTLKTRIACHHMVRDQRNNRVFMLEYGRHVVWGMNYTDNEATRLFQLSEKGPCQKMALYDVNMTFFINCNSKLMVVSETGSVINHDLKRLESRYTYLTVDSFHGHLYINYNSSLQKFLLKEWHVDGVIYLKSSARIVIYDKGYIYYTYKNDTSYAITVIDDTGLVKYETVTFLNTENSELLSLMPD